VITLENRFFSLRSAACFFIEGGIIILSVLSSYLIIRDIGHTSVTTFEDALIRAFVIAIFCQMCMYFLDLYDLKLAHTGGELFFSLVYSVGVVCIGIGVVSYIHPRFGVEGDMYYLTIVFVALFLLFWRASFNYYIEKFAPRENILIVGIGKVAQMLGREVRERYRLGYQLAGFIGNNLVREEGNVLERDEVLGDYASLPEIARKLRVRKIVVAINERRGESPVRELLDLKVAGCEVVEWQAFFEKMVGRIPIDNLPPSFFIFTEGFRKSRTVLFARQVISKILSACVILLMAPVILLVCVLIKLESPGPIIYSQDRVGQYGKIFRIYKFRSMRKDAEKDGTPRWAAKDDPRITRIGRVLRSLRLDELPQLFNVLRGDIDLVGPRPERPEFVEQLQKIVPYYSLRHTVKPGLTGWAQVMFTYSGSIEESKEKLQYDLFYIKNMSLKLDLLIFFRTLKIVILGRGAR
jgi:sugar transferase (PEP-CTERM system associated)